MELYDIIYLDVPRFESLASQSFEGLAQVTLINDANSNRSVSTVVQPKSPANKEESDRTWQVGEVRHLKNHDDLFRSFLKKLGQHLIPLSGIDGEAILSASAEAMESGQLVVASGALFYYDYEWIVNSIKNYFDAQDAIHKSGVQVGIKREDLEKAKKNYAPVAGLAKAMIGDAVECGIRMGHGEDAVTVRAILAKRHLRDSAKMFSETYGRVSAVDFSILGTVSRIGPESADLALSDVKNFSEILEGLHGQIAQVKIAFSGYGKRTTQISPIAIYRKLRVTPTDGLLHPQHRRPARPRHRQVDRGRGRVDGVARRQGRRQASDLRAGAHGGLHAGERDGGVGVEVVDERRPQRVGLLGQVAQPGDPALALHALDEVRIV